MFNFLLRPFEDRPMKIMRSPIKASTEEVVLEVTIVSRLAFKERVACICFYANRKDHALTTVSTFMSLQKCRILMRSLIALQFNYCPIVWMCHTKNLNNKVNHIYERALCIIYQDF